MRARGRSAANQVRIIGGLHRGRRLPFADLPGLRPTGDRVRETLFSWLQPLIPGARCLDLFAGSGALGLEAASRGASQVVMLDSAPQAVAQLEQSRQLLRLGEVVSVMRADALAWLRGAATPFDIVFLDPPFGAQLLSECCRLLSENGWLAEGARIYLEDDAGRGLAPPDGWELLREKRAGQVCFGLARPRQDGG
ncbi:16S rRNA (guanine(966)-N(2))-methyltransferase RsmD [endosymbiont of Ridgeia piscesae]|jgi:16S rRNA (guanine966-N2)-methyltransferase|uniref:Ribosomal RNA small subunit methyltransferase D n=1 Tax=endosymbiont of Ridgeia piscesae TaxID=54398 RepID=A0A0T5YWZ1_9GAMM|nr:16S rRNA (guanine(966)-N(2))-methyltransferase RsmD [endosymbiont of Ridgeia piscesae]KRT55184.1 16S rRNA m(2)G-966 methyltransferase [endosymbiont of Ridgeia piscesae]KRT59099.1 16S rRNA m(2)G-966 methyltransferase [endosymbiont of Ridgeia piscesae]